MPAPNFMFNLVQFVLASGNFTIPFSGTIPITWFGVGILVAKIHEFSSFDLKKDMCTHKNGNTNINITGDANIVYQVTMCAEVISMRAISQANTLTNWNLKYTQSLFANFRVSNKACSCIQNLTLDPVAVLWNILNHSSNSSNTRKLHFHSGILTLSFSKVLI